MQRCGDSIKLWDFLHILLNDPQRKYRPYIVWKDKTHGIFKIEDTAKIANLWGHRKNFKNMNYDKMSRSFRYYYKKKKMRKVPNEQKVYQFLYGGETDDFYDMIIKEESWC